MNQRKFFLLSLLGGLIFSARLFAADPISVGGAPADTGFNVGSVATLRATLKGFTGDVGRYVVVAEIQYLGTTTIVSLPMDRQTEGGAGEARYEAGWPIPADAPTGIYTAVVRVTDRSTHKVITETKLRSFAVYRKLLRIARVSLDKTFYSVGEPIQCEVVLENLTDYDLKDLRVEFSNANYPWISLFSTNSQPGEKRSENPDLALKVLRERLTLPAHGQTTIPMIPPCGTAMFLQGQQVAVLGAGGPARHEKVPPPEVDQYTLAVWNRERTVLYDMQFSPAAIIRPADRDLPKPYGLNFTHRYNPDIDFTKYREFYPPGLVSSAISIDRARTLYRPGEPVILKTTLKRFESGQKAALHLAVRDGSGKEISTSEIPSPASGATVELEAWTIPRSLAPGVYRLTLSLRDTQGRLQAESTTEIAVNDLPASLLVFCPHEDDEHAYAGLIRAAVEAGIPVRVVVMTGGDVGACERYYSKPCGPNEAREFGVVRMEETAEALEHIGLAREHLTFLGLPDGGSGAIWSENIKPSNPFLSIYLATDHAPYENVLKPNLPYARDAVIELVKQIIQEFRPAMIAMTHPDERHVDHRVTNWFVMKACHELLREGRIDLKTTVLVDQAYGAGGFKPAPYRYEKFSVHLSGEAAALKQEMSWIYQSQDGNLAEGMRKTFVELPREEIHYRVVDWQGHEGWNE